MGPGQIGYRENLTSFRMKNALRIISQRLFEAGSDDFGEMICNREDIYPYQALGLAHEPERVVKPELGKGADFSKPTFFS